MRPGATMVERLTGGCVCGNVRYSTDGPPMRVTACHCTWCRRRTGTAFGAEAVFPADGVRLRGDPLRSYRHRSDLSGRWLEQDFCSACGANIGLRLEAVPTLRSLSIGSFDDLAWLASGEVTVRHVFARSRLGISLIPPDVETHERHFRD